MILNPALTFSHQVLSIISMLQESGSLLYRPKDKKVHADAAHKNFIKPGGDHFTLLNIWDTWRDTEYSQQWCYEVGLVTSSVTQVQAGLPPFFIPLELRPVQVAPTCPRRPRSARSPLRTCRGRHRVKPKLERHCPDSKGAYRGLLLQHRPAPSGRRVPND
jgi:hypothetical protein